jgi:hypothetical protein
MVFAVASKSSTSSEQTNAFVPLCWRRRLRGTLQQTAARTSSLDGPVGDREALHLVEPPAKCFGIEIDCAIWVVGLDFKIDMTGFHTPIFSQQRVTPQLLAEF